MKINLIRKHEWFFSLFFFFYFFLLLLLFFPYPINFEDSYITYRYVYSLSMHHGFFWNFGEPPAYGMTGLVFPIIAAVANCFIANPIVATSFVGIVISAITLIVVVNSLPKTKWSYLVLVAFLGNTIFLRATSNGLETPLVILYVFCLYLIFYKNPKIIISILMVVLGFYIRPDVALIAFLFFLLKIFSNKGLLSSVIFIFGVFVIIGILTVFANNYFEVPLPLPAYIKINGIGIIDFPLWVFSQYVVYPVLISAGALLVSVLIFISVFRSNKIDLFMLSAPLIAYTAYQLTTLPIMNVGYRFFAPQLAGVVAISIIMLRSRPQLNTNYFFPVFFIVIFSVSFSIFVEARDSFRSASSHENFASLGEVLSDIPSVYIASSEAGKLAYYSLPARFFDTIGLNDAFVAKNFSNPEYFKLLESRFLDSGFPDIYVRPSNGIGASNYAYLENLQGFSELYGCQKKNGLKICIFQESNIQHDLQDAINEWN